MIKKKAPNAKVLLHNDGAIRKFIPDLIETGFDILNPIEGHLRGMDPVESETRFRQGSYLPGRRGCEERSQQRQPRRCAS